MNSTTSSSPRVDVAPSPWKLRLLVGSMVIVAVGTAITFFVSRWADKQQRDDLYEVANLVRYSVDADVIQQLSGQPSDVSAPAYIQLKTTFTELGNASQKIRYIYLMGKTDKKIFFFVDSQPDRYNIAGQPALAVPGEEYTDVTDGVRKVFSEGASTVVGPETDKWGTFISALVPVRDSPDHVIALLGVDMNAGDFISNVRSRQYLPIAGTVFAVILYALLIIIPARPRRQTIGSVV